MNNSKKRKIDSFNMNAILFVFVTIFIIYGIHGECFSELKNEIVSSLHDLREDRSYRFSDFRMRIDEISDTKLSYHHRLMDLDSIKNNILGVKVIQKAEKTVIVKSADGRSLANPVEVIDEADIRDIVKSIKRLEETSEENGCRFLYCAAPRKELFINLPSNTENHFRWNYERFISELALEDIPYIDFSELLKDDNNFSGDIFYNTDHHWRVASGFFAAKAICEELNKRYGFEYNGQYIDIDNYNRINYKHWFLGSAGKKVGTYFLWQGADDFELITPKFDTLMTEEQPFKDEFREGSFEDTVIFNDNLVKDYYNINSYATYSGGDFRLQIMKNKLNGDGKKILLIRDSFACVVAPFLALETNELHVSDIRSNEKYVGERLNLEDYIKKLKPDFVLVLYSGVRKKGDYHFIQ